jgi:small subunit ribosomal protein S1
VVVLKVEPENRKIKLGVKQLEGNPWQQLRHDYPKFSTISGVISNVTDFGVFVKVPGDIEGLISKFNLVGPDEEYTDDALKKFKVGDPITAMVIECNPTTQKLSLSIKEMVKRSEQTEIAKYTINNDHDDSDTFSLADLMKSKKEDEEGKEAAKEEKPAEAPEAQPETQK